MCSECSGSRNGEIQSGKGKERRDGIKEAIDGKNRGWDKMMQGNVDEEIIEED